MFKRCQDNWIFLKGTDGTEYMATFRKQAEKYDRQRVERGITAMGDTWKHDRAPYPAELREAIERATEKRSLFAPVKEDCPYCEGTGFEPVPGKRAVMFCRCRHEVSA